MYPCLGRTCTLSSWHPMGSWCISIVHGVPCTIVGSQGVLRATCLRAAGGGEGGIPGASGEAAPAPIPSAAAVAGFHRPRLSSGCGHPDPRLGRHQALVCLSTSTENIQVWLVCFPCAPGPVPSSLKNVRQAICLLSANAVLLLSYEVVRDSGLGMGACGRGRVGPCH